MVFIVVPLVLGSLAAWELLKGSGIQSVRFVAPFGAFIAGLLPSIYSALKLDDTLDECRHLAGEFKNLQDRFRQAALVSSKKPFAQFEEDVKPLVARLEMARSRSVTAPEWCYRRGQRKIQAGDYDFDIDAEAIETNFLSDSSARES